MGMGSQLYDNSRKAREVFDLIDDSLSFPLTKLMFEGPASELRRTINSQPAIMATSLAALVTLEEFKRDGALEPTAYAGHSVGEYTSLVTAGVLDLTDGIRLVRERGRLMQEASDLRNGGMAAIIGLDDITVEEVCQETGVEIANVNSDNQIVISGDRLSLARAMDLCAARGARKTIPLAVAGAFHSHLMAPAQEGLSRLLDQTSFRDPKAPIVANLTGSVLSTGEDLKDELKQQMCGCVMWKQSVKSMTDMGISTFVEFGPGRVLTSLIKRIDRKASLVNVEDLASAKELAATEQLL